MPHFFASAWHITRPTILVPGMSGIARSLTEADIQRKPAEFDLPSVLLRLSLEHDRMYR